MYDVMTMDKSLMGANGFFLYKMGAAFAGTLGRVGSAACDRRRIRRRLLQRRNAGPTKSASAWRSARNRATSSVSSCARPPFWSAPASPSASLAALGVTKLLSSLLVGVTSHDPLTFAAVAFLLDPGRLRRLLHPRSPRHARRPHGSPPLRIGIRLDQGATTLFLPRHLQLVHHIALASHLAGFCHESAALIR